MENLSDLIAELDLTDMTLVLQDWGGPIGAAYTLRNPGRVRRLILMNTILGYSAAVTDVARDPAHKPPRLTSSNWFRWVKKSVDEGTFHGHMSQLAKHIGDVMGQLGFRTEDAQTETSLRAYAAHFQTPADCQAAIEFPLDIIHDRMVPYVLEGFPMVPELRLKPALLAEGMADAAIPPELAIADFKTLFPHGPVVQLDGVGHFCQEDAPETLVALIELFMQMTP